MSGPASSSHLSSNLNTATPSPISGRRTWKKTKGKKEAVWPPSLETALVEGLQKYRPGNCLRDARQLRRFPKRNSFISDHIFSVTGIRRTAKQVGSRLQQMRDTCGDGRILNLLSRREYSPEGDSAAMEHNTPSAVSLPIDLTPSSTVSSLAEAVNVVRTPPRTFVTIELVPPSSSGGSSSERICVPTVKDSHGTNQQRVCLEYPSDIENNDPILTFSTPRNISTVHHYSHCQVLVGGVLAHSEITELALTSSTSSFGAQRHTYSTKLIPLFWAHLCRTAQLFQCVIKQDIMKTPTPFNLIPTSPSANDRSIRSVTYDFSISRPTAPVFYPPSLRSEPLLPPEFPRVGYPSRYPSTETAGKAREDIGITSTPVPISRPFSPPAKFMLPEEYAVYGWNFDVPAVDGLFSGTSYQHTGRTDTNPPYHGLPYLQFSNTSDSPDFSFFPSGTSGLNQWAGSYDNNINRLIPSPIPSDAVMYSEFNSNSF